MLTASFVAVLHHVEDVEDVRLVLQSRTLFQLPHQRCEVGVALRVSRQVQVGSTVGLEKTLRVNRVKSSEKKKVSCGSISCTYLVRLHMWAMLRLRNFKQVERSAMFALGKSHRKIHGRLWSGCMVIKSRYHGGKPVTDQGIKRVSST